jgi:hypothetical protein
VVHNDCGASFSYSVQGSKVTFLWYNSSTTSTDPSPKDDDRDDTALTWDAEFPILESMRMREEEYDDRYGEAHFYCPYTMSVYSFFEQLLLTTTTDENYLNQEDDYATTTTTSSNVLCVVHNDCGTRFSYSVQGSKVTFLVVLVQLHPPRTTIMMILP